MKDFLLECIENADNLYSKLTHEDFEILSYGNHKHQMSSYKMKHLLNNICSMPNCNHLAIGLYKGGSLCASLKGNDANIIAIDNWCHDNFDEEIKPEFLKRFKKYDNGKVKLIEQDCFSVDVSNINDINFYFFDGGHTEKDQYDAIIYYYPCLGVESIILVDDYNFPQVKKGTQKGIKDANLEILWETTLLSKKNGSIDSWWNGIYLCIVKKKLN